MYIMSNELIKSQMTIAPFWSIFSDHIKEAVIVLNEKFNIVLFNRQAEKLFSIAALEIESTNFDSFCHKANIKNFIEPFVDQTRPISVDITPCAQNGNIAWHFASVIDQRSEFYLLISQDLHDNFAQNEILKLETLVENMPCNVYWMDKKCIMAGCNQNVLNMLNLTMEQFRGKSYEELASLCNWPDGLAQSLKTDDTYVLNTGNSIIAKEDPPLPNAGGGEFNFLTSRVPLRNKSGEIIGVAGISTDVSELKAAKIAAEAGEKAKDEIIANFSHDMRTPLSGIITTAYELKDDDISEEKRKELAGQLADSGESLLEMFQETLDDVAAEHMTEKDIELETFDINLLVDRLIKLEKPSLAQKGLKFLSNIDPNIPQFLISDRKKIHRIILNLIGNAVKFTKKGHIELKVELIEKHNDQSQVSLKFNVIDTGIGVPEQSKKHLFERFYKASPSHKAEYKGYGLGLHIAKTYTHLLSGTISFESTEGVGSDFYAIITLKVANENEIASYKEKIAKKPSLLTINHEIESKPSPTPQPTSSIKTPETQSIPGAPHVLIVEDNLVLRKTTVKLLKKAMLNVTDVDDGIPALELAKTQHFDLILSDVGLLQMSGTEFTQKLRAFEKENNRPPVPIIGVTAHAADGRGECLNAGMNAVTQKPFLKETLMEIIKQFLPNYKKLP